MATKKDTIAAEFYHGYIKGAKSDDVLKAIKISTKDFKKLLDEIPKKKIDHAYAEGKWTIRELLQHIIDAERVFTYRALRFARKDATPLQSFDEKSWTENSQVKNRKWKDIVDEFKAVREATDCLFKSFNEEQLLSKGIASNNEINVLALGFIAAGHVEHHINIIKE